MKFSNKIAVALSLLLGLQSGVMLPLAPRRAGEASPARVVSDDQKRKNTDMYKKLLNDYFGAGLEELVRNLEVRQRVFKALKDHLGGTFLSYKEIYDEIQRLMALNPDVANESKNAVFNQFQGVMQGGVPVQSLQEIRVVQTVTIGAQELGQKRLPLSAAEQKELEAVKESVEKWFAGDLSQFFDLLRSMMFSNKVEEALKDIESNRVKSDVKPKQVLSLIMQAILSNENPVINLDQILELINYTAKSMIEKASKINPIWGTIISD